MNRKALNQKRIDKLELRMNEAEFDMLDALKGHLKRAPYVRSLMYAAAAAAAPRTHGMATPPARESRHCRGLGRPASRGGAAMSQRRQV